MDSTEANTRVMQSLSNHEEYEIYDDTIFFTDTKNLLLVGDNAILIFDKDTKQYYATRFGMDKNIAKQAKKILKHHKIKGFAENRLPSYVALAALLIITACYIVNTSNEKARQTQRRELKNIG